MAKPKATKGPLGLLYDSGALVAADRGDRRMWAIHARALQRGIRPIIPAGCIVEAWRGKRQPNLARLLEGCEVEALDEQRGKRAGTLRSGTASVVSAVGATVVETCIRRSQKSRLQHLLLSGQRILQSLVCVGEVSNHLVVDEDAHVTTQAMLLIDHAEPDARELRVEIGQDLGNGHARTTHLWRTVGVGTQRARDAEERSGLGMRRNEASTRPACSAPATLPTFPHRVVVPRRRSAPRYRHRRSW